MAGERRGSSQRVNLTLPQEMHQVLRGIADEHYGGNLSRFLGDAGMYYAGVLRGRRESAAPETPGSDASTSADADGRSPRI